MSASSFLTTSGRTMSPRCVSTRDSIDTTVEVESVRTPRRAMKARSAFSFVACLALLCVLAVSSCSFASASHFAYGTISWELTPTTANPNLYAVTFEAAFKRNYISFSPYNPTVGVSFTSSDIGTLTVTATNKTGVCCALSTSSVAYAACIVTYGASTGCSLWTTTLSLEFTVLVRQQTAKQLTRDGGHTVDVTLTVVYTDNWMTAQTEDLTYTQPNQTQIYQLVYSMCCRITGLAYSSGSYARLSAQIGMGVTYSPRSTSFARLYLVKGEAASFTIPSVHPSGWSMTYAIATTSQSSLTAAYPSTTYGTAFSIASSTGALTWTPSTIALYSIQFVISAVDPDDASSGTSFIVLDVIFSVIAECLTSSTSCTHTPVFDPEVSDEETFYVGSSASFTVTVRSDDGSDVAMTIATTPLPSGASFTYTSLTDGTNDYSNACTYVTYTFTWAPTTSSVSSTVCFVGYSTSSGMVSTGSHCSTLVFGSGDTLLVSGVLRDFHSSTAYPTYLTDFAHADGDIGLQYVNSTLGSDHLPAWNASAGATTTNSSNFAWWFNTDDDSLINEPMVYDITFNNGTTGTSNVFLWNPGSDWWPLDDLLFGDEADDNNRYFTLEIHTYITYTGGESLTFESSDDLFVFINYKLPDDWTMGGIVASQVRSYTLDLDDFFDVDTDANTTYRMDIFYAHRSSSGSPYIQLEILSSTLCNSLDSGTTLIDLDDFSDGANWLSLVGSASIDNDKLLLISSGASLTSAAWFSDGTGSTATTYTIQSGFEVEFDFYWSGTTEGFAFVMQFDNGDAVGGGGSSLGYGGLAGITNSIAIEFDGVTTSTLGDPDYQHISIHSRYATANSASETYRVSGSVDSDESLNLELNNGTVYNVLIEWIPAIDDGSTGAQWGWLRVYLGQAGGVQQVAPVVSAELDGTVLESMWSGAAYIGFTAATSDTAYANIYITNFTLTIVPPSAANSLATTQPSTITAGSTGTMVVQLKDACDNTITSGGDCDSFTVTVLRKGVLIQTLVCDDTIVDNDDGTYTMSYSPTTASTSSTLYTIVVKFNGTSISGSPFSFAVNPGSTSASTSTYNLTYDYVTTSGYPAADALDTGSVGTIVITARDSYSNLQTVNTDTFAVTFDPDLSTGGGESTTPSMTSAGYYSSTFATPLAGTYVLYVRFDSTNLPNSPQSITFVAGAASASTSTASGTGLSSGTAGVTGTFKLVLRDSGGNSITSRNTADITCISKSDGCVLMPATTVPTGYTSGITTNRTTPTNVTITCAWGSNTYLTCTYITYVAYTYTVSVEINGVAISSLSDASIVISAGTVNASKCVASMPTGIVAGVSQTAKFQLRDSWSNNLAAATTYSLVANFTPALVTSAGSPTYSSYGLYTLAFTPTVAGTNSYSVSVTLASVAIMSSPYKLTVTPGSADQLSVISSSYPVQTPINATSGFNSTFKIQSRDAYNNLRTQGGVGTVYLVTLTDTSTSLSYDSISSIPTATSEMYTVSWGTTVASTYTLNAKVRTQTSNIVDGTVAVTVNPGPTDTANCVVSGDGITGGIVGDSVTIDIVAADQWDNTQIASVVDTFRAVVVAAAGNTTYSFVHETSDSSDIYYDLTYNVPSATNSSYVVHVQRYTGGKWVELPSSPFTCVSTSSSTDLYVSLEGPNAAQAQINTLNTFFIIERDVSGAYLAGGLVLAVTIYSQDTTGSSPTTTISTSITTGSSTSYNFTVTFTPKFKFPNSNPNFLINVSRGSVQSEASAAGGLTGSPYALKLIAGAVYSSACVVSGLPATTTAGVTGNFTVLLKDKYSNPISWATASLVTAVLTPSVVTSPVTPTITLTATESSDVTTTGYVFTYDIEVAATYNVVVYYDGSSVGTSTTVSQVVIVPDAPSAANSAVQPSSSITLPSSGWLFTSGVVAGVSNTFSVIVRDQYNNSIDPTLLSSGSIDSYLTFNVTDGSTGSLVPEFGTPSYTGSSGAFDVTLVAYVANPTTTGTWPLTVFVSGVAIAPVKLHVTSTTISESLSSTILPSSVVAGNKILIQLIAVDIYGNPWNTGVITAVSTNSVGTTTTATIVTWTTVFGRYNISIPASATTKASDYEFAIRAAGTLIFSDYPTVTVVAGDVDAANTDVPAYLDSVRAGVATSVSLGLRDTYSNLISYPSAAVINSISVNFPFNTGEACDDDNADELSYSTTFTNVTVTSVDGNTTLSFVGTGIGSFLVNITIGSTSLSCTSMERLAFSVTPGVAVAANSMVTGLADVLAGRTVTLTIVLYDIYSNKLTSGGDTVLLGYAYQDTTPWSSYITSNSSYWLHNSSAVVDKGTGTYTVVSTPKTSGTLQVVATVNGYLIKTYSSSVLTSPLVVVSPNVPVYWTLVDVPDSYVAAIPFVITLQVTDYYGNAINEYDSAYNYSYTISGQTVSPSDYTFDGTLAFDYTSGDYTWTGLSALSGSTIIYISLQRGWSTTCYAASTSKPYGCTDGTCVSSSNACSEAASGISSVTLNIIGATCASVNSSLPYRCPTADDRLCVANYTECPSLKTTLCPFATPVRCASDDSCVASAELCPCPSDQEKCPTGVCVDDVATECHAVSPCASDEVACYTDGVANGQCRSDSSQCPSVRVCTPGYVACPNGISCRANASDCTSLNSPATCPTSTFRCADGRCTGRAEDCATPKTCSDDQVLCLSDGSCADNHLSCPDQYKCYSPTSVRCSDGSCTTSIETCPSSQTCPVGWVLCEDNQCASSLSSCLTPTTCDLDETRCPRGGCFANLMHCPALPTCPSMEDMDDPTPVLCPDRSCSSAIALCVNPSVCSANTTVCPDGSCISSGGTCPTTISCPSSTPILCADGVTCTDDLSECVAPSACPVTNPLRCPDGSCRGSIADCPSRSTCSPSLYDVRCGDGSCVYSPQQCVDIDSCSSSTPYRCPGGECVASLSLCPTHVTCPTSSYRCSDGSCRANCTSVSPVTCASGLLACPLPSVGTLCVTTLDQCPLSFICPDSTPVRCLDTSCAATISSCPSLPSATPESAKGPCPDGSWSSDVTTCNTPASCPAAMPYKCWDESCRGAPTDCPTPQTCSSTSTPYRCPNGACASSPYATACRVTIGSVTCSDDTPVKCPSTYDCVADVSSCSAAITVGSVPDIDDSDTWAAACPPSWGRCRDGSCHMSNTTCDNTTCTQALPYLCATGVCAANLASCPDQTYGCYSPYEGCATTGECVLDASDVTLCPVADSSCNKTCTNGLCVSSDDLTSYTSICSTELCSLRCADKSCGIAASISGTITASTANNLCTQGGTTDSLNSPLMNVCPPNQPYKCSNGLCAFSSLNCTVTVDFGNCPTARPIQCANADCVADASQCPPLFTCQDDEMRCGDGSCRVRQSTDTGIDCDAWNIINTCPYYDSTTRRYRCENGLCALGTTIASCIDLETGCPDGLTYKCPNGACINTTVFTNVTETCASAELNPTQSDGCASGLAKCSYGGQCVEDTTTDCPLPNGCLPATPFRCTASGADSGECVANTTTCTAASADCYRCADGSCAANATSCSLLNGCPIATPYRCADGSCAEFGTSALLSGATLSQVCAPTLTCATSEVLCYGGSCAATSELCPASVACISPNVLCTDRTCVTSADLCTNGVAGSNTSSTSTATGSDALSGCPQVVPVLCDNGQCVASVAKCPTSGSPGAGTGTGTGGTIRNLNTLVAQTTTTTTTANTGAAAVPTTAGYCTSPTPVECFDGKCVTSYAVCRERAIALRNGSCAEYQVMCPTGECVPDPDGDQSGISSCGVIPSCDIGMLRCADGTCGNSSVCDSVTTPVCGTITFSGYEAVSTQLCQDGECRYVCPPYDGCPHTTPYQCSNRECAADEDSCSSAADGSAWDFQDVVDSLADPLIAVTTSSTRRLLRVLGLTSEVVSKNVISPAARRLTSTTTSSSSSTETWCYEDCAAQLKASSYTTMIDISETQTLVVATDANHVEYATLTIPAGAMSVNSSASNATRVSISITAVSDSVVRMAENRVASSRADVAPTGFLTFVETVLTPMFQLDVDDSVVVPFNTNFTFTATMDMTLTDVVYTDICLAKLYQLTSIDYAAWRCLYTCTETVDDETEYVRCSVRDDDSTGAASQLTGSIGESGIYAFVEVPVAETVTASGLDWIARNAIYIFLVLSGVAIVMFFVLYVSHRLWRYRAKYKAEQREVLKQLEEVEDMMQFGGQAGVKDDEIVMMSNPLVVQMKDMQARLDEKQLAIREEEARQKQEATVLRHAHIVELAEDRDRLAAELDQLKAEVRLMNSENTTARPQAVQMSALPPAPTIPAYPSVDTESETGFSSLLPAAPSSSGDIIQPAPTARAQFQAARPRRRGRNE